MGKAPKRTFKERANPINAVSVQGAVTSVQDKEEVPVLLKKLNSLEVNERVWAAASASNLLASDDHKVRRLLLANNAISLLIERLSDDSADVVVQVAGALRNLAAVDQGAAEEMVRSNVLMAIHAVIPRLAKSIDDILKQNEDGQKLDMEERKVVFLTADNLISVLWALCETVPSSLKTINDLGITPFLVSFFNVVDKLPTSLVQTAGQFLYTLTDGNKHAHGALLAQNNAALNMFKILAAECVENTTPEGLAVVRILAGGILLNIKPMAIDKIMAERSGTDEDGIEEKLKPWEDLSRNLLQIISQFMLLDLNESAGHAAEAIRGLISKQAEAMASGAESASESAHEVQLDNITTRLGHLQLALELAANIFTDEGAEEAEEANPKSKKENNDLTGEDSDTDHEMDDGEGGSEDEIDDVDFGNNDEEDFDEGDMVDILADEGTLASKADEVVENSILGMFINTVVPRLQKLAEPTPMSSLSSALEVTNTMNNPDAIRAVSSTVDSFVVLHERALACFNNFLLVLEESLKPWFRKHSDFVNLWWAHLIAIAEHVVGVPRPSDAALVEKDMALRCSVLESAVGSMWTLTRGVEGCVPVTEPHVEGLVQICEFAPTSDLRVRAVGALGNIARRQPGYVDLNRRIGAYLLENVIVKPLQQANKDPAAVAEPTVEALDLFFDIYSDMAFDYDEPVFVRGEFLARLRQVFPVAKKFAKSIDRRKHRELRTRADLAVQNLRDFIDYKASERK